MKRDAAFTLLELVLALALSVALAALLGLAIDLHLVRLDSSRSTIEGAQLARGVLDLIAADLRAATTAPTQDVTELAAAANAAAQYNVDEVDAEGAPPEQDAEAVAAVPPEPAPGLAGGPDWVTVDRRVLRQTLATPTGALQPIAMADGAWVQVGYSMSLTPESPGLVRTESDRDHARWRTDQGQAAPIVKPIAAEVLSVRFAYYDGAAFVESWDSGESGALPAAVEVTLELASAEADDESASVERRKPRVVRRVVRLPGALEEPVPEEATPSTTGSEGSGEATAADGGL